MLKCESFKEHLFVHLSVILYFTPTTKTI